MNRTLAVLTLAGFALGTPSEAATGAAGFAELFSERGTDTLTFHECTTRGRSTPDEACATVSKAKFMTFRKDGSVKGRYFDRQLSGIWEIDNIVCVIEDHGLGSGWHFKDGRYLVNESCDDNNLEVFVLAKQPAPARAARP